MSDTALLAEVVVDDDAAPTPEAPLAALLRDAARREPTMPTGVWSMTLRVVSDATIADFHARFFGDPTATDVVSFPSREAGYLGDVLVSAETAARQADEMGHSREREIAYLALHGFLHLCGHDDLGPDERQRMLVRQDELLAAFEGDTPPW